MGSSQVTFHPNQKHSLSKYPPKTPPKTPPKRNRNSYSLDLINLQNDKIFPLNVSTDQLKLSSQNNKPIISQNKDKKLSMLTAINDQLRSNVIKISKQLSQKLKKKKVIKKKEGEDTEKQKIPQSLKKQLQNGYKQIQMYKKKINDIKIGCTTETMAARVQKIQDNINALDNQIKLYQSKIGGIKNMHTAQLKGIKQIQEKNQSQAKYQAQIQQLKQKIKFMGKKIRDRQPKEKKIQDYMYQLEKKIRQLKGEYYPQGKVVIPKEEKKIIKLDNIKPKLTTKQMGDVEAQLAILKLKQQQFKKKMSNIAKLKGQIRDQKQQILKQIRLKDQIIQGLKSQKDVLLRKIKTIPDEQQLSEFQQITEQDTEELSSNIFAVDHLKAEIPKRTQRQISSLGISQDKSQPKKWERKISRIIEKGKQRKGQKIFGDQQITNNTNNKQVFMIGLTLWLTKQKKLLGLQSLYLVGGQIKFGQASCRNDQQFQVRFQLNEGDYIKSIVGNFGLTGFLQYLMVRSKNGKTAKFGRQPVEGQRIACGLSENQVPIGFVNGACYLQGQNWRISRLSIQMSLSS